LSTKSWLENSQEIVPRKLKINLLHSGFQSDILELRVGAGSTFAHT
jgi:hypothetical protein